MSGPTRQLVSLSHVLPGCIEGGFLFPKDNNALLLFPVVVYNLMDSSTRGLLMSHFLPLLTHGQIVAPPPVQSYHQGGSKR